MNEKEKVELAYKAGDRHGIGFVTIVFALVFLSDWYFYPERVIGEGSPLGRPFGFALLLVFGVMFMVWGHRLKGMVKS